MRRLGSVDRNPRDPTRWLLHLWAQRPLFPLVAQKRFAEHPIVVRLLVAFRPDHGT